MTPDPSYYWEGGREYSARIINGMKTRTEKKMYMEDKRFCYSSSRISSFWV